MRKTIRLWYVSDLSEVVEDLEGIVKTKLIIKTRMNSIKNKPNTSKVLGHN